MDRQMIDFEGVVNCRDLGGIPLRQDGMTRSGVFFRSETPQLMTEADVRRASEELGIGRVVDLRGKKMLGVDLGGSGALGANGHGVNIDFLELAGGMDVVEQSPDGFLAALIDCGGGPLDMFLESFVSTDDAVLVHCHTGKDRTGFVVAMTLAIAGASDDNIVADYQMSAPIFDRMMANLAAAGMAVPPTAPAYAHHAPSPDGLRAMLHRLRTEWDSVDDWALDHGLSQSLLDQTRARLVA